MAPETPVQRLTCGEIFQQYSASIGDAERLIGQRVWIEAERRWLTITNVSIGVDEDSEEEETLLSVQVSVGTDRESDLCIQQIASLRPRNLWGGGCSVEQREQYYERLCEYDTYELIFKRDSFEIRDSCGEVVYEDFETPIEMM